MFRDSIREGKPIPDYSRTNSFQVWLTLRGEIERPEFLRFLEEVGQEQLARFSVEDLLVMDLLDREEEIWDELKARLPHLVEYGAVERIGRGRGVRYILSRKLYSFLGRRGAYTRRRGLDRETNKTLLLRHIQENQRDGARLAELREVLPGLSRAQVRTLLRELKAEGRVHVIGATRAGRWYPRPHRRTG
jgi:ATP-dependent DNA helicase RecG